MPFDAAADSSTTLQQKVKKCLAPLEDRVRNRSVFVFEEAAFRPDSHTLDPELAFAEEESAQAEHGGKGKGKKSRHQHRVQEVDEDEEESAQAEHGGKGKGKKS